MTPEPSPPTPSGGSSDPEFWQRAVTRWAAALAGVSLVGLTVVVLLVPKSELAGNLVNTVVAGANVAFVIFTWAVFKAGQDQIAQMHREHAQAKEVYYEAVRARLDQVAPRVSVTFDAWEAGLVSGDRVNTIQPGAVLRSDDETVRVTARWVVKNWGPEPVILKCVGCAPVPPERSQEADERIRLSPGAEEFLLCEETRTGGKWREKDGLWETHRIEVHAEDLGGVVKDKHARDLSLRAFTVLGGRLVLAKSGHRGAVATRDRSYKGLPPSPSP
ncbi:hypothetical protein GCM10010306_039180 [Streptomyces umbrinus]|uniref:hypothetical protein n=1 Tax=Streptomyces umbrinus TaxID=67370 RepID=UPI001676236D|nr:hypothetical protein [Streptomyces umbrinus]GHB41737.1 hypothetical protein GCM10010306_039180 [Streptomyces umbrinus]